MGGTERQAGHEQHTEQGVQVGDCTRTQQHEEAAMRVHNHIITEGVADGYQPVYGHRGQQVAVSIYKCHEKVHLDQAVHKGDRLCL